MADLAACPQSGGRPGLIHPTEHGAGVLGVIRSERGPIEARIDGSDELVIDAHGARWTHKHWGWPEGEAKGMVAAVLADQRSGGFWQSLDVLQKEDDPLISTAFALQALAAALPAAPHSR